MVRIISGGSKLFYQEIIRKLSSDSFFLLVTGSTTIVVLHGPAIFLILNIQSRLTGSSYWYKGNNATHQPLIIYKYCRMQIKERVEPPVDLIVKSNSEVFMTIIIGNRQIGGAILEFEGDEEPYAKGKIKNLSLGKGRELFDTVLMVETNVLDSNTAHNRIIITHNFHYEDGTVIQSIEIVDEVDNHKDVLSSDATYNFKKNN